jgi:O-antigen/teichoic acid export membrane protein
METVLDRPASSTRQLARGSALQMANRAATLLLQLGTLSLLTRFLGQLRFGDLAAGLAVVDVFEGVAEFGLSATIVLHLSEGRHPAKVLRTGLAASTAMGLAGLVLIIPITELLIAPTARAAVWVLLPSSLTVLATVGLGAYWQHRLSFGRLLAANVSSQVCILSGMAVLALSVRHADERSQLLGVGLVFFVGALVAATVQLPRETRSLYTSIRISVREVSDLLALALPVGVATSVSLLHVRADQVVLAVLDLRRGLANYALAYQVLQGTVIAANAVTNVGYALMARANGSERVTRSSQSAILLCSLGLLGSFGMALFSPLLIGLLGGHHYSGAIRACRLLAPVAVWSAANVTPGNVLIVERRARLLGWVAGGALLLNATLCLALVPVMGIAGAATATVATEALGTLAVVRLASARLPKSQPVGVILCAGGGATATLLVASWCGSTGIAAAVFLGLATLAGTAVLSVNAWRRCQPAVKSTTKEVTETSA